MKRIIALLLIALSLVMVACGDDEPAGSDQSTPTDNSNIDVGELEGELKYQYDLTDYITLPKYKEEKIEIELDDIQKQIDSYILSFSEKTNKTICMIGDVVDISYIGYMLDENGKILHENGRAVIFDEQESYGIYLGSGLAHSELEKAIIGMSIGEQCDVYVTMPSDYSDKSLAGKRVLFDVQLSAVFDAPLYNDKFVSENFKEYKTTAELENSIITEKILDYLNKSAEVKKYPEKEYNALVQELKETEEGFQKENGVSLDEYIKNQYGMTRDEYIKSEIKSGMIIYALAQAENLSLTDDELLSKKKELVSYYISYYMSKGESEKNAAEKALAFVNDLGKSYLYEQVAFTKLTQGLTKIVQIEKKSSTYKSITASLLERAYGNIGNEIGKICPSFDAEVFSENGSLDTTLNPSRNVGKVTLLYFWDYENEASLKELSDLNKLAREYEDKVTVYAIHPTQNYGGAPDYLMENLRGSKIIFLKDYKDANGGEDAIAKILGASAKNPYLLIIDKDGIIRTKSEEMSDYDGLVNSVLNLDK